MRWALRMLVLAQLATIAVFGAISSMTAPRTAAHQTSLVLQMLLALVSQTGFYLGIIACVVAIVASLQWGERRWARVLIVLLVLALFALPVIQDVLPNIRLTSSWLLPLFELSAEGYRFVTELVPGLVLDVVVLVFSFWRLRPRPAVSGRADVTGVGGIAGATGATGMAAE